MSVKDTKQNESNDWDDDGTWDNWEDAEEELPEVEKESSTLSKEDASKTNKKLSPLNNSKTIVEKDEESAVSQSRVEKQDSPMEIKKNRSEARNVEETSLMPRSSGWGSLFGGVVSSVFSSASEGLGNITSTVTQGLDKVIGVPDPVELARINRQAEAEAKAEAKLKGKDDNHSHETEQQEEQQSISALKFGTQLVSGVTNLGSKVISTGLDTLEGIGKKTMDILQENDPQIKHKIKMLALESEQPNLSQVLKLAKAENEELEESLKRMKLEKSKFELRFEVLFEHYCGLAHMEAVEILSREANIKINAAKEAAGVGKQSDKLVETLKEVEELMELVECDEDECNEYDVDALKAKFDEILEETPLRLDFDEILCFWSKTMSGFSGEKSEKEAETDTESESNPKTHPEAKEVFSQGLHSLSELCALEAGRLHKISELLLVQTHHRTASEVVGIVQLCHLFIELLQIVANGFASCLNQFEAVDIKSLISDLFAEMIQARQQIEKARGLFLPILQLGAT